MRVESLIAQAQPRGTQRKNMNALYFRRDSYLRVRYLNERIAELLLMSPRAPIMTTLYDPDAERNR